MDQAILNLYDEYTHRPLPRRVFLDRLTKLAGSAAAAAALLPLLDNNYAKAAVIADNDPRVSGGPITFAGPGYQIKGYLAKPKAATGKMPGVIVIHENRGLNPHLEDVARRAAVAGFVAIAPDGLSMTGGTPPTDDGAREAFAKLDRNEAVKLFVAAVSYLKNHADSTGRVGAVGFCWGGGMAHSLSFASPDLASAVAYYGAPLPATADVAKVKIPMLLNYGGLDTNLNGGLPAYEAAAKAANVKYTLYVYEGANHAFNNDTNAARFDKAASDLAWQRTVDFFNATLKPTPM